MTEIKDVTPKHLRCIGWGQMTCPAIYEVTPSHLQCDLGYCPGIYEATPKHMRCEFGECPAVYEHEQYTLIVGKVVPVPYELVGRIGPDEALVRVPKGMVKPGDEK